MENDKSLHTYTLVFEGPNDQSTHTLQVLKGVFIADFNFSAAEVMAFLNNAPVVIKRSEDLEVLKPMFHRLVEAGARVLILESNRDDLAQADRQQEALQHLEQAVRQDAWKVFGDDDHPGSTQVSSDDVQALPFGELEDPSIGSPQSPALPTTSVQKDDAIGTAEPLENSPLPASTPGVEAATMTLSGILMEADPIAPDPVDIKKYTETISPEVVVPLSASGLLIDELPPAPDLSPVSKSSNLAATADTVKATSASGLSLDSAESSPPKAVQSLVGMPGGGLRPTPVSSLGGLSLNEESQSGLALTASQPTMEVPRPSAADLKASIGSSSTVTRGSGSGLSLNPSTSGLSLGNGASLSGLNQNPENPPVPQAASNSGLSLNASNAGLSLNSSNSGLSPGTPQVVPAPQPTRPTGASNSGLSLNASNSGLNLGGGSNSGLKQTGSNSGLVMPKSPSASGLSLGGSNSGLAVGGLSVGGEPAPQGFAPAQAPEPANPGDGLAISFDTPAPTVKSAALESNATAALEAESATESAVYESQENAGESQEADEDVPLSEKFKKKRLEQAADESNQRRGTDDEIQQSGLLVGTAEAEADLPLTRWEKLQEKIPLPIDILVPVVVGTLALLGFHVWQYRQQAAEQEKRATPKVTRSAAPAQSANKNPASSAEVQKKSNVLIDYVKKPQDAAKGVAAKLEARDAAIGSQVGGIAPTE